MHSSTPHIFSPFASIHFTLLHVTTQAHAHPFPIIRTSTMTTRQRSAYPSFPGRRLLLGATACIWIVSSSSDASAAAATTGFVGSFWGGSTARTGTACSIGEASSSVQRHQIGEGRRRTASAPWGLHASTLPPPSSIRVASSSSPAGNTGGKSPGSVTVEDFAKQLEPFGVTGIRFGDDGQEDELAVCCPESRRLMDCTVDMYASINGTNYCVALPIFSPVAICYHKNERLIPVENECELMDRLYDFLAPTLEQEDLFLIRSPVCLTLDGDLGDLGEDGEFSEEELAGWEAFESEDDPWQDGEEEEEDDDEEDKANKAEPLDEEIERLTNPKYWDDAEASDVREAYGEDWEKIAAFTYDGVDYTMVKILEPVLVLAKEDPEFKGITSWILPSEDEAEEVAPIMEGIIKVKLGIDDMDEDDDDDEEE